MRRSVGQSKFSKRAESYTSTLLSEHLFHYKCILLAAVNPKFHLLSGIIIQSVNISSDSVCLSLSERFINILLLFALSVCLFDQHLRVFVVIYLTIVFNEENANKNGFGLYIYTYVNIYFLIRPFF